MQVSNNNYSIIEIIQMLDRGELIVNKRYQRASDIWPLGPSSYFIETILRDFPFPKIYLHEYIEKQKRIIRKEIVDGQQRIGAIRRFYHGEFALSSHSKYAGKKFSDLDEDTQNLFLSYSVSVDVIRNAHANQILELFRRMNAYTIPLNEAEKRHSSFQGKFKWFINDMNDEFNAFFVEFGVLTNRQIMRMSGATLLTDCIIAIERGIVHQRFADFTALYNDNDEEFPQEGKYVKMLRETFDFINKNFPELRNTLVMRHYALHSLVTALMHCNYEIPEITTTLKAQSIGKFAANAEEAHQKLLDLHKAHEARAIDGPYGKYVWGSMSTTHGRAQRTARVATMLRILGVDVPESVDANLA